MVDPTKIKGCKYFSSASSGLYLIKVWGLSWDNLIRLLDVIQQRRRMAEAQSSRKFAGSHLSEEWVVVRRAMGTWLSALELSWSTTSTRTRLTLRSFSSLSSSLSGFSPWFSFSGQTQVRASHQVRHFFTENIPSGSCLSRSVSLSTRCWHSMRLEPGYIKRF